MMGTPNSLSSERAESSELLSSGWTSTSYSGILPLPLSDFGLGRDVLSSRGGSCGPISSIELGSSFCGGLGRASSSELAFNTSSIGSDGVAILRCRFVKNDVATYPNHAGRRVEALVCFLRCREDTRVRVLLERDHRGLGLGMTFKVIETTRMCTLEQDLRR